MEENYDENVSENYFFQELKSTYKMIFQQAIQKGWIICIPRRGTFSIDDLNEDSMRDHILIINEGSSNTYYHTLGNKKVTLLNKILTVLYDTGETCDVNFLFEETFYNENLSKYCIWCIERPFSLKTLSTYNSLRVVTSARDSINLLQEIIHDRIVFKDLEQCVIDFEHTRVNWENKPLEIQKDCVHSLYTTCFKTLLNNSRLKKEVAVSKYLFQSIKVSLETYVLHSLRRILPESLSTCMALKDAYLNKIVRNLNAIEYEDLGIHPDLYSGIHRGKLELSRLNCYVTVLGKLECLKRTIRHISQDASSISSDDLLPIFIYLVIKTNLPNWSTQVVLLKYFRFSASSVNEADEAGFLITSLEAAVEHIKSGALTTPDMDIDVSKIEERFALIRNPKADTNYFFGHIKNGDLSRLRPLLTENFDSSSNISLCHPLCSCDSCKKKITDQLVNQSMVHLMKERKLAALHIAALYGQITVVEFLLNHNANVNQADANEVTPLHCASSRGHQNVVLLLLHAKADPKLTDNRGNTALHAAADHGHEGCVKALLYFAEHVGFSLNVDSLNLDGDTPLHRACKWGYLDIIEILIKYGANSKTVNKFGQTPFGIAHSKHVTTLLRSATSTTVELNSIIHDTHHTSPQILHSPSLEIKNKSENKCSINGCVIRRTISRLFAAIAEGDVHLAHYYLGLEGQDNNEVTQSNLCHPLCDCEQCVLMIESSKNRCKISTLIINAYNNNGETILHVACTMGYTRIVRALLDSGAEINVRTKFEGRTPLHLACLADKIRIVKLILNCVTCNVNSKDFNGDTSLHIAARTHKRKIIDLLIRAGANTKIRNLQDTTPRLELEKQMSKDELLKISKDEYSTYVDQYSIGTD